MRVIGSILDDRLKEKFLKPWKGVLCIHFRVCVCVCVSVCSLATGHTFWPRNLSFGGLNDPWNMRKKCILGRSLMIGWRKKSWNPERVPSVVTLSVCLSVCERATGHTFWLRNLIFELSDTWDMRKIHIFLFFEICIFTLFTLSCVSVCPSVRPLAGCRTHFLAQEPNFLVEWSLRHEKNTYFCFLKFAFLRFYRHFSIFFLI